MDASAGTYLWALQAWWDTTGDRGALASLAPSVRVAVEAIVALQDSDGLTWARADWPVKCLMDQAETHAGLVAAVALADVLGLDEVGAKAEQAGRRSASMPSSCRPGRMSCMNAWPAMTTRAVRSGSRPRIGRSLALRLP